MNYKNNRVRENVKYFLLSVGLAAAYLIISYMGY